MNPPSSPKCKFPPKTSLETHILLVELEGRGCDAKWVVNKGGRNQGRHWEGSLRPTIITTIITLLLLFILLLLFRHEEWNQGKNGHKDPNLA